MTLKADPFAPETRDNPTGFRTREFTVQAERAGEGDDAPLRLAISSEAPVDRYDYYDDLRYDEILDHGPMGPDLEYVRDGIPFCLDHALSKQIGIGTMPTIGDDGLLRTDITRGSHPDAAWVFADMAAGIRKKVSIGYWPGERYTQSKNLTTGRTERRFVGWRLYEASSVVVPADYTVGVGRSALSDPATLQAGDSATSNEASMDDKTASVGATIPAPDTRAAELSAMARDARMPEMASEWILNGTTVNEARAQMTAALVAKAESRAPISSNGPAVVVGAERAADKPFADDGADFFRAVVAAGRGGDVDVRLRGQRAQNTVMGEEGGFAVPAPVVATMLEATITGGEILSRVATRPVTTGNSYVETLVKEEARTNGSRNGGVRAYWLAEDGTYTESQAATRQLDLKLQKLGALVKLTEEQIEDGPALVSYLNEQVPEELRFVTEQAVWEGDGAGKPLGATVSGALVTVPIEATQTIANTSGFIWINAAKMYARMPARMLGGSAWFINQMLYARILTATAGTAGGSHPMFTAPGQLATAPFGALYGRPLVPVEYASAEGTVGDFVLANFADYLLITKGGVKQATSLHAEFVRDRQLMKFTLRVNGAPRTRTPLTPFKGADTLSPYIALATRA